MSLWPWTLLLFYVGFFSFESVQNKHWGCLANHQSSSSLALNQKVVHHTAGQGMKVHNSARGCRGNQGSIGGLCKYSESQTCGLVKNIFGSGP